MEAPCEWVYDAGSLQPGSCDLPAMGHHKLNIVNLDLSNVTPSCLLVDVCEKRS